MSGHFHSDVGSSTSRIVVSIFLFFGVILLKYLTGFLRESTVLLFSVVVLDDDVDVDVTVIVSVLKVVYSNSSMEVSSLLIPTVIFVFASSTLIMLVTRWNVVVKTTTQKNALNLQ